MIRKILVPVRGDGKGDGVLGHASALAHRHGSHIEVIHCRARPEDLMPFGVPLPDFLRKQIVEQSHKVADQTEEGLREELEVLSGKLGLDIAEGASGPSVSFIEEAGRQVDVIKRRGRLADIIMVAKPDRDRNLGHNSLKAALFHSGRPVMMCPPTDAVPKVLGGHVAFAWNGSEEAARALSQCRSVFKNADKVTVLTNGSDAGQGTLVVDLIAYLGLHGIGADTHEFGGNRSVGQSLLSATEELGADLLFMGAYGDSHERETVFGGNTQTVVDSSKVPVLLNH